MSSGTPAIPAAQKDTWETPVELFDSLWDEFGGFDYDPCCSLTDYSAKKVWENGGTICVPRLCGSVPNTRPHRILVDGLTQPWKGRVYMNPPYGLALRQWVPKAVHEVEVGNAELVVALLPVRTDTRWWQKHMVTDVSYDEWSNERGEWLVDGVGTPKRGHPWKVRFLKGRLKFGGAPANATFPSCIVVWRK